MAFNRPHPGTLFCAKMPTGMEAADPIDLSHFTPDFEERLPRRFQAILSPPQHVPKKQRQQEKKPVLTSEQEWVQVRQGETFPQYNARIKRGQDATNALPVQHCKIMETTPHMMAEEGASESSRRKAKRKAFLKSKKQKGKKECDDQQPPSTSRPHFADVAKGPAKITARPKANLSYKGKVAKRYFEQ